MSIRKDYWTHNVAYHDWILNQIEPNHTVLDVGCGDGFLVQKTSKNCKYVIGIEPHSTSVEKAKIRLSTCPNVEIINVSFEEYKTLKNSIDVILFVASIHHMDLEQSLIKSKELLSSNGKIIIVGCAKVDGIIDIIFEILRVIPAKIGSFFHKEINSKEIDLVTQSPSLSYKQIKDIIHQQLPNAKIQRALYYRYLMSWNKH